MIATPRPLGLLLLTAAAAVHATAAPVAVDGTWTGTLARGRRRETFAGSATLAQRGTRVTGWLELHVPEVVGAVPLTGSAKPRAVVLAGSAGETRVRWVARWRAKHGELRGPLRVRGPGGKTRGVLALHRDDGGAPSCGGDYFAGTVMPEVLVPVCAQCHVRGGLADFTTFRVTPDDPVTTAASAATHVDLTAPSSSRLLRKPRGELSHGGGTQLAAGSARDAVLAQWIAQVADCGGGGGGGGGSTGARLYGDYCAGCHGADAGGLPGGAGERPRPDVRCASRVADAVTTGRGAAMPPIPELDAAAITAIAQHLDGLCTQQGRTGAALFAANCITCHGLDARGATSALGVEGTHIRCHRGIAATVRDGLGDMPAFPGLAPADVGAIADFLAGLCPSGSAGGDELYASNCARCHGDDAGGRPAPAGERRRPAVRCSTPPRIADALARGRADAMPSFPDLIAADRGALTGFLDAACMQAGRPASDLYDGNCASCHGATGRGGRSALGIDGPDIACTETGDYAEKISDGEDDMPAFPELVPDAATIAAYVRGASCRED